MPTETPEQTTNKRFYCALSADSADAEKGVLQGVSLMSKGIAKGHDIEIDDKTLETIFTSIGGKSVKAFIDHKYSRSVTEVIGYFSGVHRDGDKLRAKQFQFLKSFMRDEADEFSRLIEIATEHADTFGISFTLGGKPFWKIEGGGEVEAKYDWWNDEWEKPDGAEGEYPALRVYDVYSADFVDSPAANDDGLFSAKPNKPEPLAPPKPQPKTDFDMSTIKDITRHFADNNEGLAFAVRLAADNDKLSASEIIAQTEGKLKDSQIKELSEQLAKTTEKITQLEADLEESKAKLEEYKEFGARPVKTGIKDDQPDILTQLDALPKGSPERAEFFTKNEAAIFAAKQK